MTKDTTAGGVEAVREALAALKPFVDIANEYDDAEDDDFQVWRDFDVLGATLPLRNFRRARAAHERLSALIPPAPGDGAGAAAERARIKQGLVHLGYPITAELAELLAASPAPAPAAGVGLPQDVVRLVIAAREVAYSDPTPETFRELDKASEAFADRVPWEDEPKDDAAAVEPWFCGGCGETNPEKRCLGCMHGMEYPAPSPKAGETGNG